MIGIKYQTQKFLAYIVKKNEDKNFLWEIDLCTLHSAQSLCLIYTELFKVIFKANSRLPIPQFIGPAVQ